MDQKASSKTSVLKKWSLLRISIIVLGNLVIFGLGFALGLHYAQNLYLAKKEIIPNPTFSSKYNDSIAKTPDEFSFFYGLKKSDHEDLRRSDEDIVSKKKKENLESQRNGENKDLESRRNILTNHNNGYTIQLYSFKSKDVSEKKILELKDKGYPAYQSKIDLGSNDIYYRVRVGHFKDREEAARILKKILVSETKEAYITRN